MRIKRFNVFENFTRIAKKVPVYGTDRTTIVSDPVVRITILIKN